MAEKRSLVTIANLTRDKIMYLIEMAAEFENILTGNFWKVK